MVEEAEVVLTTLNGLPREWDSFIRGICARKRLAKFSKLWEECVQEGRITNREEKLNGNEDQALAAHTKNGRNKRKDRGSPPKRSQDFKRGNKLKMITHLMNVIHVISWDPFPYIVHLIKISSRRGIEIYIPCSRRK